MSSDSINRTLVLSVVAVDLVGYSRKSVAEQMSLKGGLNQVLLQAIRDISIADRIILDTGDGVAMGFLGDPEDALYVAMFMHDAINRDRTGSPSGGVDSNAIRIGINLGPVKLATGTGGHPNIIGDGINVAERIMGFAEPGQLTASRAFYEVMSRMSDHYATLFLYAGVHTDKQVRAHDVYTVGKSAAAFRQAQQGVAERAASRAAHPVAGQYFFQPASPAVPAATVAGDAKPRAWAGLVAKAGNKKIEPPAPTAKALKPVAEPLADAQQPLHALIDFLMDRNKVATTATLLVVMAVTLAALLAYRKMQTLRPDTAAPVVVSATPADTLLPADVPASPAPAPVRTPAPLPAPKPVTAAASPPLQPAPASNAAPTEARPVPAPKTEVKSPAPATPITATAAPAAAPSPVQPPPASKAVPTEARPVFAPKTEVKPTAPATPITVPAAALPPIKSSVPATTAVPVTAPVKGVERTAPVSGGDTPASAGLRDKSRETRIDKPDRGDKADKGDRTDKAGKADKGGARDEVRKPLAPRAGERLPPGTGAPIVPAYQSPAEAPRPESVAPTPAPSAPPAPVADTVDVLTRTAPAYPIEATRQSITSGFVKARIIVDANGNVSDVVILESRPISAFGRETRVSAKQWKYNRGTAGRIHEIEITFKP